MHAEQFSDVYLWRDWPGRSPRPPGPLCSTGRLVGARVDEGAPLPFVGAEPHGVLGEADGGRPITDRGVELLSDH
jgi:hypothetical protein